MLKVKIKSLVGLVCSVFIFHLSVFASEVPVYPPGNPTAVLPIDTSVCKKVRIAVLKKTSQAILSSTADAIVKTIETDEVLAALPFIDKQPVKSLKAGVKIGFNSFKIYGVRIVFKNGFFWINKEKYRGDLIVYRQADMSLLFVNAIDLEDYVKGVVPREVSPNWQKEALKAQAVVARTYAVYREVASLGRDYSLEKTVASQVYGGADAETVSTNKAVDETASQVLVYFNEIFPAYFHANCGGTTTGCETVWYSKAHPAMCGVACSFCRATKHYNWQVKIKLREIEDCLIKKGFKVKGVKDIEISSMDDSGRATRFNVISTLGEFKIKANLFRLAIGAEKLKSTKIAVLKNYGDSVFIQGLGWGHGVGLCQWGAKVMAENGYSYEEIVKFYFAGTEIKKL